MKINKSDAKPLSRSLYMINSFFGNNNCSGEDSCSCSGSCGPSCTCDENGIIRNAEVKNLKGQNR